MQRKHTTLLLGGGILSLLVASTPAGALRLEPNGALVELRAEQLDAPQSQDKLYVYTKSENFSRWVHSPWAKPRLNGDALEIHNPDTEKRAVLSAEVNLETSHLNPARNHVLRVENDYLCRPTAATPRLRPPEGLAQKGTLQKGKTLERAEPAAGQCHMRLTVRCYGKTATSDWGITFEKVVKEEFTSDGTFIANDVELPGQKCQQGVHLALETSVTPKLDRFAFQRLRLGLTER